MITDAVLGMFLNLANSLLSLIPTYSGDDFVHDGRLSGLAAKIGSQVGTASGYFPVVTLGWALVVMFAVYAVGTVWTLALWAYHQFWGSQ